MRDINETQATLRKSSAAKNLLSAELLGRASLTIATVATALLTWPWGSQTAGGGAERVLVMWLEPDRIRAAHRDSQRESVFVYSLGDFQDFLWFSFVLYFIILCKYVSHLKFNILKYYIIYKSADHINIYPHRKIIQLQNDYCYIVLCHVILLYYIQIHILF